MSNFIRSQAKPRQKPRPLNTSNLTQSVKTLTQNSYIDNTITQLLGITEKQNKLHTQESMSLFNELFQLLISNHTSSAFPKMSNIVNNLNINRDAILVFYIDLLGLVEEKPDSWITPILRKLKRVISENWDDCFLVAEQKPSSSRFSWSSSLSLRDFSFENTIMGKWPPEDARASRSSSRTSGSSLPLYCTDLAADNSEFTSYIAVDRETNKVLREVKVNNETKEVTIIEAGNYNFDLPIHFLDAANYIFREREQSASQSEDETEKTLYNQEKSTRLSRVKELYEQYLAKKKEDTESPFFSRISLASDSSNTFDPNNHKFGECKLERPTLDCVNCFNLYSQMRKNDPEAANKIFDELYENHIQDIKDRIENGLDSETNWFNNENPIRNRYGISPLFSAKQYAEAMKPQLTNEAAQQAIEALQQLTANRLKGEPQETKPLLPSRTPSSYRWPIIDGVIRMDNNLPPIGATIEMSEYTKTDGSKWVDANVTNRIKADLIAINKEVEQGYIKVQKHPTTNLFIYNYTQKAQYEQHWSNEVVICRGLILDDQGYIKSRPFAKFFNYEQLNGQIPNEPFEVYEKLDGSLGILYWVDSLPYIATRGSFTSEQAQVATKIIQSKNNLHLLDQSLTYLFEIIYPDNRIVVNYGDVKDIFLLAIIDTQTGKDLPLSTFPASINIDKVKRYNNLNSIEQLLKAEEKNKEGFVLKFESGQRVKIKFSEYKRLHKLLTGINTRHIWEILKAGQSIESLLEDVPDEYFDWIKQTERSLKSAYSTIELKSKAEFKTFDTRKETALYFKQCTYPTILFQMLDNKDYSRIIWDMVKPTSAIFFRQDEENQGNPLAPRVSPSFPPTQTLSTTQPSTLEGKLSESRASTDNNDSSANHKE